MLQPSNTSLLSNLFRYLARHWLRDAAYWVLQWPANPWQPEAEKPIVSAFNDVFTITQVSNGSRDPNKKNDRI